MRRGPLKSLIAYENQLGSISEVIDGLIADVLYGRFLTINKGIRENSCDHTIHQVSKQKCVPQTSYLRRCDVGVNMSSFSEHCVSTLHVTL